MKHLKTEDLEASLDWISQAPRDSGALELIVRRPAVDEREVLSEARLDVRLGLVGDRWSSDSTDGIPNPDIQLTLMNTRVIALLAQTKERWPLAGDQLFVNLDLSAAALPAGTRLEIGPAVVEITAKPHTGCAKFSKLFGKAALRFVNAPAHKQLRLRGVNAKVIKPGVIKAGDRVRVMQKPEAFPK